MSWLSKRKFVIVCHEKVVRIPLECDEILRVHGEHLTMTNAKTSLSSAKVGSIGATPVAKSPYRLAPSEMQELPEQLQELQDKGSEELGSTYNTIRDMIILRIGRSMRGGAEREEAFQTLKNNLCDAPILSLPDGVEDFVVYCDALN
ncbi:hypothetical protein Tco_1234752 [Tanacetum coccineum]